uniref:Uncharacterized protein n=1 Tax=Cucumis melo TaxID=3656 RepID=A0A9I9EJ23_CUCME
MPIALLPLRRLPFNWIKKIAAVYSYDAKFISVSALLSSTIGIHYGHVLLHFEVQNKALIQLNTHSQRLKQWVAMGFGFFIIGIILHFTNAIPINKQLYSFSYVCFIAEAAGIVFSVQSFVYFIVVSSFIYTDRRLGFFKAILISRMDWNKCNVGVCNGSSGNFATFINGWYYKDPENSLMSTKCYKQWSTNMNEDYINSFPLFFLVVCGPPSYFYFFYCEVVGRLDTALMEEKISVKATFFFPIFLYNDVAACCNWYWIIFSLKVCII